MHLLAMVHLSFIVHNMVVSQSDHHFTDFEADQNPDARVPGPKIQQWLRLTVFMNTRHATLKLLKKVGL
jgi:hypothetical protein